MLAQLLERLEHSTVPVGAEQYRSVVAHLVHEFEDVESGADLSRLLDAYPAAAEVYENLNYQHAGLCRSALDASLAAETRAGKRSRAPCAAPNRRSKEETDGQG